MSKSGTYNSPTPAVARARRAFERQLEVERRRRETQKPRDGRNSSAAR